MEGAGSLEPGKAVPYNQLVNAARVEVHNCIPTHLPGTGYAVSLPLLIVFQAQVAPGLANRLGHTDYSKVILEGVEGAAALIAAAMRHAPPSRSRYPRVPAARQVVPVMPW